MVYDESAKIDLQFGYQNKSSTLTQVLVSALENVHISWTNTDETVLNYTEIVYGG